jgi:hypothetical protein
MGSLSKILLIALITLASVAFIFVVIALGMGGRGTYTNSNANSKGGVEPVSGGAPVIVQQTNRSDVLLSVSDCNDVFVLEYCEQKDLDTEKGKILVTEVNIDPILPLCVTDDTVADWSIIYAVCGGYEPQCGTAQLVQKDGCHGNLLITFTEIPCDECHGDCCCCGWVCYEASFDVVDDCICLDSNHLPSNPEVDEHPCDCPGFNCWITTDPDKTLGKEVDLKMWETWQGCNGPDQSFQVILAHKSCIRLDPPSE